MAQSTRMTATPGVEAGGCRRRARGRRVAAAFALVAISALLLLAPLAALAAGGEGAEPAAEEPAGEAVERSPDRVRAEQRLRDMDDGEGRDVGFGSLYSRSGLLGTALLGGAFYYFFFMRGRVGAAASWSSYNLFWFVAPAVLAVVSARPEFLIVIVVGLVARRWLPDPLLILKHRSRVRSLQIDIDGNAANATARRDMAKIWLEKHRPRRALPLLEQAIARDPDSIELLYLSGVSYLLVGQHQRAVEALVTVVHREPNFQYGEAYLRAADALMALGRWDDADDALERYVKINSSSMEGRTKRVRVCKARNDAEGVRKAQSDLRDVWRSLPAYQRRRQFGWYLRSLF
jgi:tetratricopeptide (TPR) repeat protein